MADMLLEDEYDETWAAEEDDPDDSGGLMSHAWRPVSRRSAPSYSADGHTAPGTLPPDAPAPIW